MLRYTKTKADRKNLFHIFAKNAIPNDALHFLTSSTQSDFRNRKTVMRHIK